MTGRTRDSVCRRLSWNHAILRRVARIFRFLPRPPRASRTWRRDPPEIALISLAAVGNGPNRFKELRRRGVVKFGAAVAAGSPTGFWRMSGHPAVQAALRNHYFDSIGPPRPCSGCGLTRSWNRRSTRPVCPVGGAAPRGAPLSRSMSCLTARHIRECGRGDCCRPDSPQPNFVPPGTGCHFDR